MILPSGARVFRGSRLPLPKHHSRSEGSSYASDSEPLASGEFRRQIGLKLRAQDTCNLV